MRTPLFFTFFLLFGALCTAQELIVPDRTLPGVLASFDIAPEQEAVWHIVTPLPDSEPYRVDSGLSKIYFASPQQGRYTVIAGIVVEGKAQLLVKTFTNGEVDETPHPVPSPPDSSLETWVKTKVPLLVKSKDIAKESRLVADCFDQIVRRIDEDNIKTVQNARAQLQIALIGTLALASPTAVTEWTPFLVELSHLLEMELGTKIDDLAAVKTVLQNVAHAMKPFGKGDPTLRTTLQGIDTPKPIPGNTRTQGTQNRVFRTLLTN